MINYMYMYLLYMQLATELLIQIQYNRAPSYRHPASYLQGSFLVEQVPTPGYRIYLLILLTIATHIALAMYTAAGLELKSNH